MTKTNPLFLALASLLLLAGCDRDDGIRTYNAPKDAPPPQERWKVPSTWKALTPGPMIKAAYQVSIDPPIKLTVSQVTSMGSGAATVLANVNRWEGQLGLPKTSEANIAKLVTPIPLEGGEALLIDLKGPDPAADGKPQQRMLAAMVPDGEQIWVFKMTGAADQLEPQKPAFEGVVKSFHLDAEPHDHSASANPPPAPRAAPPQPDAQLGTIPGISSYTLPEGWRIDPQPRQMREATIIVPGSGNEAGELVVSRLSVNSLADLMPNLNRWRGQVKLPATNDPGANAPQAMALAQGPGVIRDFEGPESAGAARLRQFVAYTQFPQADRIWFFRLVGPYNLVTRSKPQFEAFVKSLKFDDK
ncbi:MAG: hypothetical protein JWN40_2981 [Phycisphaerales bacterium]|nr:hypothetical protein [Phycisphaerales bacterium]